MSETTSIEWCDRTWSPWEGCTKVSPGCDHCYAAARNGRFAKGANWGPGAPRRRTSNAGWDKVLRWNEQAGRDGTRPSVFPSLCDPFDNEVDEATRGDFFWLVEHTPHLRWLLLTKRIGNATQMLADLGYTEPIQNVWLGATVVDQEEGDRDIPKLLATPAAVRFLSCEPLLGSIDLRDMLYLEIVGGASIDWIIAGGESGPGARPMHPDWARSLRDQCAAARVPFLFKQWGEWAPNDCRAGADLGGQMRRGTAQLLHAKGNPEGFFRRGDAFVERFGKKAAGRLLDGVEHNGFPGQR